MRALPLYVSRWAPTRRVMVSKGDATLGLFAWLFRRKQTEATKLTAQAKHQWHLLASEAVEHALRARYDQLKQRVESDTQTEGLHCTKDEMLSDLRELTTLQCQAVDTIRRALQYEQDAEIRHLAADCLRRLLRDGDQNSLP
jgi:hypothetical protein